MVTPSPTPDTDALYAEAERVILAANKLEEAYLLDADNKQYPPGLTEFFADPYLEASKRDYATIKGLGYRTPPGAEVRSRFQQAPEELDHDADVAIRACRDTTDAPFIDEHGTVTSPGNLSLWVFLLKDFDGQLKLFGATAYGEVEQCPFE
ncbi:MAG: hypothetical protein ACOX61_00150 [Brooklawnia sp.]